MSEIDNWPPPYQIRHSARAKRLSIRLCPQKGLELVVPTCHTQEQALAFLNSKRDWVLKHYSQHAIEAVNLPDELCLLAINKQYVLSKRRIEPTAYRPSVATVLLESDEGLCLVGETDSLTACLSSLRLWLKQQARLELSEWLSALSKETGLPFNKLSWRFQKTLWGSCSTDKNISLNVKLLLLPPDLVKQVMLHELCHTRYMNHGKRFWQLVAKHQPNYRELEKALHVEAKRLPAWVGQL